LKEALNILFALNILLAPTVVLLWHLAGKELRRKVKGGGEGTRVSDICFNQLFIMKQIKLRIWVHVHYYVRVRIRIGVRVRIRIRVRVHVWVLFVSRVLFTTLVRNEGSDSMS
jgi:hypothetical protein